MRFPAGQRATAEELLRLFPQFRESASRVLGIEKRGDPVLVLVEDYKGMVDVLGSGVPEWAVAIARRDDRIVFRLDLLGNTPAASTAHVAAHEAVHQVIGHNGGTPLPRWFEEGICVHQAGVSFLEMDYRLERVAAAGNLPTFAEADGAFQGNAVRAAIGYRLGQVVVEEYLSRFGEESLRDLLRHLARGRSFEEAFVGATGVDLASFEREWRAEVTPFLPFWLYVLLENLELTLLVIGAAAVLVGYVRWRLRRESALRVLDRMP